MFARKPVLGWGLGTFPEVYPQFRTFYTNFFINAAHNDYVQLLVEMGALGLATMLWLLVLVYRNGVKKLKDWPRDTNGGLALAALLGISGILFHSLVDFNLQIPANAAIFYMLCVLAAMEPRFGQFQRRARKHRPEPLPDLSTGHFSSLS
jgi:O-antigen ligase